MDPEIVVDSTENYTEINSCQSRINALRGGGDLHSNPGHIGSAIPETEVPSISSPWRRVPWHYHQVEVDQNVEQNNNMPGFELRFRKIGLLASPSHEIDPSCQKDVVNCVWIELKADGWGLVSDSRVNRQDGGTY